MPVAGVGDTATTELSPDRAAIEEYAALTGDDNPLHTDPDYAGDSIFSGIVAHGMFVAGAISSALAALPGDVVYVSQDLSFTAPVRPGDNVVASVEVVEDLGEDRLRVDTEAAVEGETVIEGEAVVLSLPHGEDG